MTRKEYINLCREISSIPDGIAGTRQTIPSKLLVTYDGITYYPLYYEMHFKNGDYYDIAALHSLKANCIVYAPLEKVGEYSDK